MSESDKNCFGLVVVKHQYIRLKEWDLNNMRTIFILLDQLLSGLLFLVVDPERKTKHFELRGDEEKGTAETSDEHQSESMRVLEQVIKNVQEGLFVSISFICYENIIIFYKL
jgi:hypothetical protein